MVLDSVAVVQSSLSSIPTLVTCGLKLRPPAAGRYISDDAQQERDENLGGVCSI